LAVLARDILSLLFAADHLYRSGAQFMMSQQSGIGAGIPLAKTAKIAKEEKEID
jgi:hypothetical protein